MFMLSAYYATIYKYSGQEDIVVGSPVLEETKRIKKYSWYVVNTLH